MIGKNEIRKILSDFSYPLNKKGKNFIHNMVYCFEKIGLARIYLKTYYNSNKSIQKVTKYKY